MEMKLEMVTKWLKGSGIVVKGSKTEICLFHRNDPPTITIRIDTEQVQGTSIHIGKGHEPEQYDALGVLLVFSLILHCNFERTIINH